MNLAIDADALASNLRVAGFEKAARKLATALANGGVPCVRHDTFGQRIRVRRGEQAEVGLHGGLVAELLGPDGRPRALVCTERTVICYRDNSQRQTGGRPRAFEGPAYRARFLVRQATVDSLVEMYASVLEDGGSKSDIFRLVLDSHVASREA
jgi:hypothetical protein